MDQNEIDLDWSSLVAGFIVEELVAGKVVKDADRQFAEKIAAQQVHVFLVSGCRPDSTNRRYQPGGVGYSPLSNLETLRRLALAHRDQMIHLTWADLAQRLQNKPLLRDGETWGREEDGQCYDVGDTIEWVRVVGGDIRHRFYASEDPATEDHGSVYFTRIVRKPRG